MILVDTWTWIEIFRGTDRGKKAKQILTENYPVYTSMISVAEISQWADKNNQDKEFIFKELEKNTTFLELDFGLLKNAGKNYNEIRKRKAHIGMVDVIIYTAALAHDLTVLTGDPDFEGLPGVKML